jgi:holo-[acyl-carrier protein] synthase
MSPAERSMAAAYPPVPQPLRVCIGTDLMPVAEIAESVRRFGRRYLSRIYTEAELAYCTASAAEMPRRLAARFAAKEAVFKLLRPAEQAWNWRDVEILRTPGGWCQVRLHGPAERLRREAGVQAISLSLSHEADYAIAVAAATAVTAEPSLSDPN